jgi:hypothetical protein
VSGIFLPLRVNSLPLATIYEVKIPLRKWKKSLLQRNPAQMTWSIVNNCKKMTRSAPRARLKSSNYSFSCYFLHFGTDVTGSWQQKT